MEMLELIRINVLSPMVLAFVLGMIVVWVKSDLRIPEAVYTFFSIYLLFSIGLEGGFDLAQVSFGQFIGPALSAVIIGVLIPLWTSVALTRFGGLDPANAIAISIHYGGVSSVTLSAGIAFLADVGVTFEGFLPTLYVIMELPAYFVALLLVAARVGNQTQDVREVARIALTGKAFLLLGGGVLVGFLSGENGRAQVEPFFLDLFPGILTLFLLQMGTVVGERFGELRGLSVFVFIFAMIAPVVHAFAGVLLGTLVGLSPGGAFILGVIAASASFISAPAVVQANIPQANPGIHMGTALGITFPFNLVLGIPIYYEFALLLSRWMA